MKIRALIAEDEPLAEELLRNHLMANNDLEVVGVAKHGREALELIVDLRPDVLFLDIQMPEKSGLEVACEIIQQGPELQNYTPLIVFITAYDQYAIQAFEHQAIDYILKPFTSERIEKMVARLRHYRHAGSLPTLGSLLHDYLPALKALIHPVYTELLTAKDGTRIQLIKVADITHVEAEGNYVRVYTLNNKYLLTDTLTHINTKLDPQHFVRIHRSTIVNIHFIKEIRTHFNGDANVILSNQVILRMSRNYKQNLKIE